MRINNDSDQSILSRGDAVGAPWLWYDTLTLDGAAAPWKDVPLGSMYWRSQRRQRGGLFQERQHRGDALTGRRSLRPGRPSRAT